MSSHGEIDDLLIEIWGVREVGREFMRRPHVYFQGKPPAEVAASGPEGRQAVLELLGRLKAGTGM